MDALGNDLVLFWQYLNELVVPIIKSFVEINEFEFQIPFQYIVLPSDVVFFYHKNGFFRSTWSFYIHQEYKPLNSDAYEKCYLG